LRFLVALLFDRQLSGVTALECGGFWMAQRFSAAICAPVTWGFSPCGIFHDEI